MAALRAQQFTGHLHDLPHIPVTQTASHAGSVQNLTVIRYYDGILRRYVPATAMEQRPVPTALRIWVLFQYLLRSLPVLPFDDICSCLGIPRTAHESGAVPHFFLESASLAEELRSFAHD